MAQLWDKNERWYVLTMMMTVKILYCNGSLQHSLWTDTFSFLLGIRSREEASHHIVLRVCSFINKSARLLTNRIYLNITKRYKNWGKTLVLVVY